MFDTLRRDISELYRSIKELGLLNGTIVQANREALKTRGKLTTLFIGKDPVTLRNGTSDLSVFHQIFVEKEYAPLNNLSGVKWIIDCGANVGYSAVYFLKQFPQSKIICIEPDSENFKFLEKNLKVFSERVILIKGAVWPYDGQLAISSSVYRDGKEWSRQVCIPGENNHDRIEAFSINSIVKKYQIPRISILKIDIEGAEIPLFNSKDLSWIDLVDNLAVELHDDTHFGNATQTFSEAFMHHPFYLETSGELTIAKRSHSNHLNP